MFICYVPPVFLGPLFYTPSTPSHPTLGSATKGQRPQQVGGSISNKLYYSNILKIS